MIFFNSLLNTTSILLYHNILSHHHILHLKTLSLKKKSVDLNLLEFQASWFLDNRKFKIRKVQINFLTIIAHILDHSFYLSWWRLKSQLLISEMNDKCDFSIQNLQFTAAVENAVQYVLIRMNIQLKQQLTQD